MPGTDIFPDKDAEFNDYINNCIPYLIANKTRLGISADNATLIGTQQTDWSNNWSLFINPATHTSIVTAAKNRQRKLIEQTLRAVYGDIPKSALTIDDRRLLNLKERDTHGTRVPPEDHAPAVTVESTTHLQHTLRFQDSKNPHSNAMPHGQKVVLEYFAGAPGAKPADIVFGNDKNISRALATVSFTEAQVGQTCYYHACYENTHGERGPWSAVLQVVVG